jgi:hypothetical protein
MLVSGAPEASRESGMSVCIDNQRIAEQATSERGRGKPVLR